MGTETARIYLVHTARDAALARAIATELTSYGLRVSDDYLGGDPVRGDPVRGDHVGRDHVESRDPDGVLVGETAVVVLCTPAGMRDRALRRRAAVALAYAHRHPGAVLVPLLLDPRADPTTMFGPYEWLAPASTAPADVAAAVFEEAFAWRSLSAPDQLPPAEVGEWSVVGSPREALRVANRAIAQAQMVRRVLWSAAVAVVVLTGLLAVLVLVTEQSGRVPLLVFVVPLIGFAAALAALRPTRRI